MGLGDDRLMEGGKRGKGKREEKKIGKMGEGRKKIFIRYQTQTLMEYQQSIIAKTTKETH